MNIFDSIIQKALKNANSYYEEAKIVSDKLEKALDLEQPLPYDVILPVGSYQLRRVNRHHHGWVQRIEIFKNDGTAPWMPDQGTVSTNIPPTEVLETVLNTINTLKND